MFGRWFGRSGADQHYQRGIALLHRGEFASAVVSFELCLQERSDPDHPTTALAHFYRAEAHARLGRSALAEGDDEGAVQYLDRALETQPHYPDLRFCLGLAKFRLGDDRAALGAATIALRHNRKYLEAQTLVFLCHVVAAETVLASEALLRCQELAARRSEPLAKRLNSAPAPQAAELIPLLLESPRRRERIERAQSLLEQGLWPEARDGFEELVRQHPTYPDLRLNLARALFGLEEWGSCLEQIELTLAVRPDLAEGHALAGIVLLRAHRIASAREHFTLGYQVDPRSSTMRYGLAVCHLLLDELAECTPLAEQLGREHPDSEAAQRLLALCRALSGEGDAGVQAAKRWAELGPGDSDSVLDRIALALDLNRPDLARKWLSDLPDGAATLEVAVCRARTLAATGDARGARDMLLAAERQLGPQPSLGLELADLALRMGDPAGAIAQLERDAPTPSRARLLLARALRRAERASAAAELLSEPAPPSLPERLERLFAERALGDNLAARDAYEALRAEDSLQLIVRAQEPSAWSRPFFDLPQPLALSQAKA